MKEGGGRVLGLALGKSSIYEFEFVKDRGMKSTDFRGVKTGENEAWGVTIGTSVGPENFCVLLMAGSVDEAVAMAGRLHDAHPEWGGDGPASTIPTSVQPVPQIRERLAAHGRPITGCGDWSETEAALVREAGWSCDGDESCAVCGLHEMDGRFPVCQECDRCKECAKAAAASDYEAGNECFECYDFLPPTGPSHEGEGVGDGGEGGDSVQIREGGGEVPSTCRTAEEIQELRRLAGSLAAQKPAPPYALGVLAALNWIFDAGEDSPLSELQPGAAWTDVAK